MCLPRFAAWPVDRDRHGSSIAVRPAPTHLSAFDPERRGARNQPLGAGVGRKLDQQIAAPRTILARGARGLESLHDPALSAPRRRKAS